MIGRIARLVLCLLVLFEVGSALADDGRRMLVKSFGQLQRGTWSILDVDVVRRWAAGGDREAVEVLAWMFATGTAIPPNPIEAFRWYLRAAQLGTPRALDNARIVLELIQPRYHPYLLPELERLERERPPEPPPRLDDPDRAGMRKLVVAEAVRLGLPPGLALAVAHVESRFDPRALSRVGARGVMQVMPQTAMGEFGVQPDKLWDPVVNVRVGLAYLGRLIVHYQDVSRALAHYNGGTQAGLGQRVPLETRSYVGNVISLWRQYEGQRPAS